MTIQVIFISNNKDALDELHAQARTLNGVELLAHQGSARLLLAVLQKERPDVVLLDMPQSDAQELSLIEAATAVAPGVPVVLLSPDASLGFLKQAMRAGVRDILPIPISEGTLQRAVDYVEKSKTLTDRYGAAAGHVLAFLPVKGGAGATFLATNLAFALSERRQRVLVIDLNLYFGDAALHLTDRKPISSVVDLARQRSRLDTALLATSVLQTAEDVHVLAAPNLPYLLDEVTPEAVDAIVALARTQYDFVLLDVGRALFPGSVKALDHADRIFLTLQLSLPAIQDTRRIVTVLEGLGYAPEKLGLVVNRLVKGSLLRPEEVERMARVNVVQTVVESHESVSASVNQGVPLIRLSPRDVVARTLRTWAEELAPLSAKRSSKGWLQTLTGSLS